MEEDQSKKMSSHSCYRARVLLVAGYRPQYTGWARGAGCDWTQMAHMAG